jgi:predicted Zn-dependent protease
MFSTSFIKISKKLLLPALISFSLSSCASFGIYGTDYDKEIGQKNAQVVAVQMGLYEEAQMSEYVKTVGARLVKELDQTDFTFQFEIVDDEIPNAFALPGGYIYITRGLLALMNNEDELATVLAHEIIHVTERHSIKQMRSSILPSIIEIPGNIVGLFSQNLGGLINAPISAGNDLLLSGYSRSHETDSDSEGIVLAAKAGYDPLAMNDILIRLNNYVAHITKTKQEKSYFDSHPFTPDRVTNISEVSKDIVIAKRADIDPEFPMTIDHLVFGKNPVKGVFIENQFFQPLKDLSFAITLPKQWEYINQPLAVVAVNKKKNAFVVLTMVKNDYDAKANAMRFKQLVAEKNNQTLDIKITNYTWGGTGYRAQIKTEEKGQKFVIQVAWVDFKGITYEISGVSTDKMQSEITASLQSFRPLSKNEFNLIKEQAIHIVVAKKGESLTALLERSSSVVDKDLIVVLNGLDAKAALVAGQKIKIVVEQAFKQPSN